MKKYIIPMFVIGLLFASNSSYAEEAMPINNREAGLPVVTSFKKGDKLPERSRPQKKGVLLKKEVREVRRDINTKIKKEREDNLPILNRIRKEEGKLPEKIRERKDALSESEMRKDHEDFATKLKNKREGIREEINTKREKLKNKLKNIKDTKKQEAVLRISDNINKINIKATDRISNFVKKLEDMLNIIKVLTNKVEAKGLDVSSARTAIANAESSIVNTKTLIDTQVGKTYTIDVTTESTLRETVKSVKENFKSDIENLHKEVKASHESVRNIMKILKNIKGESDGNQANTETDTNSDTEATTSTTETTTQQ